MTILAAAQRLKAVRAQALFDSAVEEIRARDALIVMGRAGRLTPAHRERFVEAQQRRNRLTRR